MGSVFDTLFLPINQGLISVPNGGGAIGVFNGQAHPAMRILQESDLHVQQNFKPYYDGLVATGYHVRSLDEFADNSLDMAFIHVPQNMIEAQGLIAQVCQFLRDDGVLVCAADNKAGGNRIKKLLAKIGLNNIHDSSKHRARVCWGIKGDLDIAVINSWIEASAMQVSSRIGHHTQPGIFGWDKVDKGSEILAEVFKRELKGKVADFGCGYGYLSLEALKSCDKIRTLYALDADQRAVEACRMNCDLVEHEAAINYQWADLTRPSGLKNLDHIIMNPPFHTQKATDISVGVKFIENAHAALARGGRLWMVANAHLPYERVLDDLFFRIEKPAEMAGFKVFIATK